MRGGAGKSRLAKGPEAVYRARQVTGLLIIGGMMVAFALVRAHWHEVFPTGWWRVW
jgi:hypothetical protein